MRNRFDQQLSNLNVEMIKMGALCEQAISLAASCMLKSDKKLISKVMEAEEKIDQMERSIESLCMKLLLQQQPVARDLRTVSSALKIIADMERIGDQAADIAEILQYVGEGTTKSKNHIGDMARATINMVTSCIDSFVKKDIDMARKVIESDDEVDTLFTRVKDELAENIREGKESAEYCLDLLMIAKYFERIGDHAVNIAEWVCYSISGEHVEEK